MPPRPLDLWLQRLSVGAMVAIALTLLGVGVALYGPKAPPAGPPLPMTQLFQEER